MHQAAGPTGLPTASACRVHRRAAVCQAPRLNTSVAVAAFGCYEGYMPLVGLEEAPKPLLPLVQQHSIVVIGDSEEPQQGCLVLDYLPLNPKSPLTAFTLIRGQSVPGELRIKQLPYFLKGHNIRTRWVAPLAVQPLSSLAQQVQEFNRTWNTTQLHLLDNNCTHYTNALLAFLQDRASTTQPGPATISNLKSTDPR